MKTSNTEQAQVLEICLKHIKHELLPDSLTKYKRMSEVDADCMELHRGYFDLDFISLKCGLNDTHILTNNEQITILNERLKIKYSLHFQAIPHVLYNLQKVNRNPSHKVFSFSNHIQDEYVRQQGMDKKVLKAEIKRARKRKLPHYDSGDLKKRLPLYVYDTYFNN